MGPRMAGRTLQGGSTQVRRGIGPGRRLPASSTEEVRGALVTNLLRAPGWAVELYRGEPYRESPGWSAVLCPRMTSRCVSDATLIRPGLPEMRGQSPGSGYPMGTWRPQWAGRTTQPGRASETLVAAPGVDPPSRLLKGTRSASRGRRCGVSRSGGHWLVGWWFHSPGLGFL